MAERRIIRHTRSNTMQNKVNLNNPVKHISKEKNEDADNKAVVAKSKDATVEVTVKVKKRRDKSVDCNGKFIPLPEREFRKGSWGDLLTNSRGSLACQDNAWEKKSVGKSNHGKSRTSIKKHGEGDEHSPLCQKIPITNDLYLETHTHIRKSSSSDGILKPKSKTKTLSSRQSALLTENEDLRDEIERLRMEVEISRARARAQSSSTHRQKTKIMSSASTEHWNNYGLASDTVDNKAQTQATQTSTHCLLSPKKKVGYSQTDDGRPKELRCAPKEFAPPNYSMITDAVQQSSHFENLRLEKENEKLRREAAEWLTEMNKARTEYLECCSTMKELYHIAENLKRDNQNLVQNSEKQQSMQNKLLQALAENQEMKEVLDTLMNKQQTVHEIQDDQLTQIRNVIKDVKMTIAQEMQGLALQPSASAFLAEKDYNESDSAFRIGDSLLNDTNASEIQKILGTQPETRRGIGQEDLSSSTQYLTIGGFSAVDRPSPLAISKFSPRISTPNSSSVSLSLSEAGASGFIPIKPSTATEGFTKVNSDNEWKMLEEEVVRSFIPVRNELSMCSTSSYSSTSSTPNSIKK